MLPNHNTKKMQCQIKRRIKTRVDFMLVIQHDSGKVMVNFEENNLSKRSEYSESDKNRTTGSNLDTREWWYLSRGTNWPDCNLNTQQHVQRLRYHFTKKTKAHHIMFQWWEIWLKLWKLLKKCKKVEKILWLMVSLFLNISRIRTFLFWTKGTPMSINFANSAECFLTIVVVLNGAGLNRSLKKCQMQKQQN